MKKDITLEQKINKEIFELKQLVGKRVGEIVNELMNEIKTLRELKQD